MSSSFVRIGRFVLDVSLSETHDFEADVTDYPVESGGSISDNIRAKPINISIEGVITDSPLKSNADNKPVVLADPYGNQLDPLGFSKIVGDLIAASEPAPIQYLRSDEAFKYLLGVWAAEDVVTIRTSMGTFDNMAMKSLNVPRSKDTTGGLKFTASFQQIQKITNDRVRTRVAVRNGHGKKNRGVRAGEQWASIPVIWFKGRPAGGDFIYDTEEVRWESDPVVAAGGGSTPVAGTGASLAVFATTAAAKDTHQWYHLDGNLLSPNEVRDLNLDIRRERRLREEGRPGSTAVTDLQRAEAARHQQLFFPETKSATTDYHDAFKKGSSEGFLNPKDPNFKNKDAFDQGMGKVGSGKGLGNVGKGPGLGNVGNGRRGFGNI